MGSQRKSKLHCIEYFMWSIGWLNWTNCNVPIGCCQETNAGKFRVQSLLLIIPVQGSNYLFEPKILLDI